MYAIIHITRGVRRTLAYHERKVQQNMAELLYAGNFLELPHELNRARQIARFENLAGLNQKAETKTMLATLSFHPADQQKLTKESLTEIARLYLAHIGFAEQPYLVFVHRDTAHPHLHIVTSLIRPDGSRINTHFIGATQSNAVRKGLEQRYGLVRADRKEQIKVYQRASNEKDISPRRLEYGKSYYKPGIARVLNWVLEKYSTTNFRELNAILSEYRVIAIAAKKEGRMRSHGGLVYKMLDPRGNPIGIPIHASSLLSKPTLANLEKKFQVNGQDREVAIKRMKIAIAWTLATRKHSLDSFLEALRKENVAVVQEGKSFIYIDHRDKTVFEDKNLGDEYLMANIIKKLAIEQKLTSMHIQKMHRGFHIS